MCTAVEETNIETILAVMNTTELVVKIRPAYHFDFSLKKNKL